LFAAFDPKLSGNPGWDVPTPIDPCTIRLFAGAVVLLYASPTEAWYAKQFVIFAELIVKTLPFTPLKEEICCVWIPPNNHPDV
jgi:hypothetical protein